MQTPSGKCILDLSCAKPHVHIQAQPANPKRAIGKTLLSCCQERLLNKRLRDGQWYSLQNNRWAQRYYAYYHIEYITFTSYLYNHHQTFSHLVGLATWINQHHKALSCIWSKSRHFTSKSLWMVWPIVFLGLPLHLTIGLSSIWSTLSLLLVISSN